MSSDATDRPLTLAAAAHRLEAARREAASTREVRSNGNDAGRQHLKQALRDYVAALERQGLPVASKIQSELRMLETLDVPIRRY